MDSVTFRATDKIKQIVLMFDNGDGKMINDQCIIDQYGVLSSAVRYEVSQLLSDGDEMCNFLKKNKNNDKSNKINKENIMENLLDVKTIWSVAYGK